MQKRELSVAGAFEFTSLVHDDDRGSFSELFRSDLLEEATGRRLPVAQVNTSVSRRGVLRGIHFADVPPGQAKYVTVSRGTAWDVVVDLRVGSPTFGHWDAVTLTASDARSVFIPEGLGHAFVALDDDTSVSYLVSDVYRPGREHGVDPLDPELGIEWPIAETQLILSAKDAGAPSLKDARDQGLLPQFDQCMRRYDQLAQRSSS